MEVKCINVLMEWKCDSRSVSGWLQATPERIAAERSFKVEGVLVGLAEAKPNHPLKP